jgi:hypothetical protein
MRSLDWLRLLAGSLVWAAFVGWTGPGPLADEWAAVLLLFAPLVLVPLVLRLARPLSWPGRIADVLQFPAALALAVSFLWPVGTEAALWTLPWLGVTALVCLEGLTRVARRGLAPLSELCLNAGLIFLLVGGLWASAARAGLRPLDFEDRIVLLTANHFHYAGFVLPIVAGLAGRRLPGWVSRWSAAGVLAGVPLVAAGITATQLGFAPWLECLAALVMAAAGLGVAWLHLMLAWGARTTELVRALWAIAGLALAFGMVLAGCYGLRFYLPLEWLSIPWMRALHGTANTFGFALAGVLAWLLAGHRRHSLVGTGVPSL